MTQAYLADETDGLVVKLGIDRARERYRLLTAFIQRYRTTQGRKKTYFLDLRAGSGKVKCSPSGTVLRTPALAAVSASPAFQGCWLAETHKPEREALQERIRASEQEALVHVLKLEPSPAMRQIMSSLSPLTGSYALLAYLDADNLALDWDVVTLLSQLPQAELLLDFSSAGLVKGENVMYDKSRQERFDAFFGTSEWRKPYQRTGRQRKASIRRALLDFYRQRLGEVGYSQIQEITSAEDGSAQYRLLYATQGADRSKIWQDALRSTWQLPLF